MFSLLCDVYPGSTNSVGESVFVGILTSIAFGVILWVVNQNSSKKENIKLEEHQKKVEKDKYLQTLKSIVKSSGMTISYDYDNTISQLTALCNPKNYLEPYQPEKLKIATELYTELKSISSPYNKQQIRTINKKADEMLLIKLPSEDVFIVLKNIFNPQNFVDDNFDEQKLLASNKAYQYIFQNKNDLRKLQEFAYSCGVLDLNDVQYPRQTQSNSDFSSEHAIEDEDSASSTVALTIIAFLGIVLFCLIMAAIDSSR